MLSDAKTGVLLIMIGLAATIGLTIITGRQAVSRGDIPNPAYDFGFCIYKTAGEVGNCYESVKRLHTDEAYRRCMQKTPDPAACLKGEDVIKL